MSDAQVPAAQHPPRVPAPLIKDPRLRPSSRTCLFTSAQVAAADGPWPTCEIPATRLHDQAPSAGRRATSIDGLLFRPRFDPGSGDWFALDRAPAAADGYSARSRFLIPTIRRPASWERAVIRTIRSPMQTQYFTVQPHLVEWRPGLLGATSIRASSWTERTPVHRRRIRASLYNSRPAARSRICDSRHLRPREADMQRQLPTQTAIVSGARTSCSKATLNTLAHAVGVMRTRW